MRETIRYGFGRTSIAHLLVARSSKGVAAISISEHMDEKSMVSELARRFPAADLRLDKKGLRADIDAIEQFVESPTANIELPLDICATEFQRKVYDAVLTIPLGEIASFADVARGIGHPNAVRAVGSACTRNPLEFAIPCHRVLRSDGSWSGGGKWGDWRQSVMVTREREAAAKNKTAPRPK